MSLFLTTFFSPQMMGVCQSLVKHLRQWWSSEYLNSLQRFQKWRSPTRNFVVNNIVLVKESTLLPTHWPLARVTRVYKGNDGHMIVVDIKSSTGESYKLPVHKLVLLLPEQSSWLALLLLFRHSFVKTYNGLGWQYACLCMIPWNLSVSNYLYVQYYSESISQKWCSLSSACV